MSVHAGHPPHLAEVAGTVALKYTNGFTNLGPSALVVAGTIGLNLAGSH